MDRREFLQLLGSAVALTACTRQPVERIAPYVRQPEGMILGQPLYFASALCIGGVPLGVLVTSREGRPIKIEGNPDHPSSLGATDRFSQAMLLSLYDPDRAQVVQTADSNDHRGASRFTIQPLSALVEALQQARLLLRRQGGLGLRLLTETVASPTLGWQIQRLLAEFPLARWHQYEPALPDYALRGTALALGTPLLAQPHIDRAEVIFALDADFLSGTPGRHGGLRSVREFARRRQPENGPPCRLYVAEVTPSLTGAKADHALRQRPSQLWPLLRALAARLGVGALDQPHAALPAPARDFVETLAADLQRHRGRGLVLVGDFQQPRLHALAALLNHALGHTGTTITYTAPAHPLDQADQMASLRALSDDMNQGLVECLLCLGGNPVYTAPADIRFGEHLQRVPLSVHLSPYHDETAALSTWHVPESHPLESWSDLRAGDGTASIVQPLIEPLYQSRSAHELLAGLTEEPERSGHDLVRAYWQETLQVADFPATWRAALRRGIVPGTAAPEVTAAPVVGAADLGEEAGPAEGGMEVVFRPDPTLLDGRFASNAWLQELPKPLSGLTWDVVAAVSPATAGRLGFSVRHGEHGRAVVVDVAQVALHGRSVRAAVWVQPGQPDECVTLFLGGGRTSAGHIGAGIGYNANLLRSAAAPWHDSGLVLRRTTQRREIGVSQVHHQMEGRDLVQVVGTGAQQGREQQRHLSLYRDLRYDGYAWGMAIDLAACVGCGACVLACQAENNIPTVGPDEVRRGREMHWLRVDCYYEGDQAQPQILFQPVPCMHCENAPCEQVCPVEATVHDAEGLNAMVYNRCVGTRYCSNNCPYKVRRFNFLRYQDWDTPSLKLMRNPEVTVRSRGVMEKCTYCVQRIAAARSTSERQDRRIRDGEIRTACQQVCPAQAIVFGDIHDPASGVSGRKASPRDYALLGELNTKPRTTYQAEVKNPAPGLPGARTD